MKLFALRKYFFVIGMLFGANVLLFSQTEYSNDSSDVIDAPYFIDESDYFIENKINWNKLFDIFLYSQKKLINHPMISFNAGLSFQDVSDRVLASSLPFNNFFNLEYGFVRYDAPYKVRELNEYSSEFVFIEYNSNNYGFLETNENELTQNLFSFGMGLRSGLGVSLFDNINQIYGLHTTAFTWSVFNYDAYTDDKYFNTFHKNWKFGNKGTATIEYRFNDNVNLNLEYDHINVYSGMEYGKWIGSWFFDLLLQRWIDILDPLFVEQMGLTYSVIKFLYKNSIAAILSEARKMKQFYPFNSDYSLLQRRIGIRIKFVF